MLHQIKDAHSPNRNANGMLSLFPEAEIIASETNGPITADVLPTFYRFISMRCAETVAEEIDFTTEKSEKKRNLHVERQLVIILDTITGNKDIWGKGETSHIMVWLKAYHGQTNKP
jgi:hypothetical protein